MPLVRRYRRQGTVDTPYRLAENYYPVEFVDDHMLLQMQQDERFDVLRAIKEKYGKVIVQVHEDVIGRLPTTHPLSTLSSNPSVSGLACCTVASSHPQQVCFDPMSRPLWS